jgi:uncharacterized protein (TIGR00369 family)
MSNPPTTFGVVPAATAMQTDGLTFLRNMISQTYPSPPFAETSDIWLVMAENGRVLFEATPAQKFLNPLGTIHGGWISTLLDSAMGCAVHSTLKPGHGFTTVDMTVSFVRAVLPTTGKLTCEGKIIHSGGRIATAEGRVTDANGKLIAHGTETCMILNVNRRAILTPVWG